MVYTNLDKVIQAGYNNIVLFLNKRKEVMNTKFEKIVFAIADADETWNVFILVAALVCAAFIGIGVAV